MSINAEIEIITIKIVKSPKSINPFGFSANT